jgi:hypothetical protein
MNCPNTKMVIFAEPFQVALLSSKDHYWLFSVLYLIRVFVAMVLKVSLLEGPVWRLFRAVCKEFQRISSLSIIVPGITSMPFGFQRPVYHLVPVATLPDLSVPNMMSSRRRHGGVICHAHDVLPQSIEAMVNVVEIESLIPSVVLGDNSLTNKFLYGVSLEHPIIIIM